MESSQQEAEGSEPQQQPEHTTVAAEVTTEAASIEKVSAGQGEVQDREETSSVVETAQPGDAMLDNQGPSGDASSSRPLPLVRDSDA